MSTQKETTRLVNQSLNLLSKLIDSDTEISNIDLNLLENLNTNQSLNYIKLEQNLNTLEKNANRLEQLNNEFKSYTETLNNIEDQVSKIEFITKDLDNWSRELELKVRKQVS